MKTLPAIAGWQWIKQGFSFFRQQPAEISTLFVFYLVLAVLISVLPGIGLILKFLLVPAFSFTFLQACADIEQGKRVHPRVLLAGFRSPAFKSLLMLGVLYLLVAIVALLIANLIDNGALWQAISNPAAPDAKTVVDPNLVWSVFFAAMVYLSISLLLWFATPLIAWQNMSVGKAIFFSFFTVIRAFKAFLLYLLAWMTISMLLMFVVSAVLRMLVDDMQTEAYLLMPFIILLMTIVQCTFYPSYTYIFGVPQPPEKSINEEA